MTMPLKRLIDPRRMRKGLPRGFGWIDHRLLRDGYLTHCSPQALSLYVFLVCASDALGLSYYSGPRIAQLLGLEPAALSQARRELIDLGLIALPKTPLSTPEPGRRTPGAQKPTAGTTARGGRRTPSRWNH
jgi:hypothetical protein